MYHHEMILVIKEEAVAECLKWWHTLVHPLASVSCWWYWERHLVRNTPSLAPEKVTLFCAYVACVYDVL